MPITARTRLVALLGYPVGHSLSPLIHNAAFAAQQLDFRYVACPVHPDRVRDAIAGLVALGFVGANVTIPHKQAVIPFLDHLSAQAQVVGAVNTIVCRDVGDGSVLLTGDNTDVAGFLRPLHALQHELMHGSMLLFGVGGAARAVLYALLTRFQPRRLHVVGRDMEKVLRLVEEMKPFDPAGALHPVWWREAGEAIRTSRLLVNATPLGMHPHEEESVWPEQGDYRPDHILYDLVYNPPLTRWLREGRAHGAHIICGEEMFIGQAAAAYEQWTDVPMPLDPVQEVLDRWRRTGKS